MSTIPAAATAAVAIEASTGRDPFMPRRPAGMRTGLALALLAHALLIAGLAFSVDWHGSEPAAVEAELWSAVPQQAAPRAAVPTPSPTPPQPQPQPQPQTQPQTQTPAPAPPPPPTPPARQPAPAPKLQPVQPPPPPPPPVDPQIAIEKARQAKQLQAQRDLAEQEQARRDKARRDKARQDDADRQQAERDRQQQQQQAREDQARKKSLAEKADRADKAEKAEKAEREKADRAAATAQQAAARAAYLKRIQGLAGASGESTATGSALKSSGPSSGYAGRIMARIKPNIVFSDPVDGNPTATVEVRVAPDGSITSRRLVQSSGVKAWDDAVLRAIDRTDGLPRDIDGRVQPVMLIAFKPRDF